MSINKTGVLAPRTVMQIRYEHAAMTGRTVQPMVEFAAKFDIDSSTLSRLIRGLTWKHLPVITGGYKGRTDNPFTGIINIDFKNFQKAYGDPPDYAVFDDESWIDFFPNKGNADFIKMLHALP